MKVPIIDYATKDKLHQFVYYYKVAHQIYRRSRLRLAKFKRLSNDPKKLRYLITGGTHFSSVKYVAYLSAIFDLMHKSYTAYLGSKKTHSMTILDARKRAMRYELGEGIYPSVNAWIESNNVTYEDSAILNSRVAWKREVSPKLGRFISSNFEFSDEYKQAYEEAVASLEISE